MNKKSNVEASGEVLVQHKATMESLSKLFLKDNHFRGFLVMFDNGVHYSCKTEYDVRAFIAVMELELLGIKSKLFAKNAGVDALADLGKVKVDPSPNPITG